MFRFFLALSLLLFSFAPLPAQACIDEPHYNVVSAQPQSYDAAAYKETAFKSMEDWENDYKHLLANVDNPGFMEGLKNAYKKGDKIYRWNKGHSFPDVFGYVVKRAGKPVAVYEFQPVAGRAMDGGAGSVLKIIMFILLCVGAGLGFVFVYRRMSRHRPRHA